MSTVVISPPANQADKLDLAEFVYRFGQQPDSWLATGPGRTAFWSEGRRGLVSYTVRGGFAMVGGGLICPPDEQQQLLLQFLSFCKSRKWRPVFFFIPEDHITLFRNQGWFTSKVGEDTLLDTADLAFTGPEYEWVRRQSSYCRRHGVTVREVRQQDFTETEWCHLLRQLSDVCASSMRARAQQAELKFLDGSLDDHELGHRRLFLAETQSSAGARIEGYVVCNPIRGGQAWSTEIYRHRQDSVRGTVPFLIHQIVLKLKHEGVREVSLCLAPGQNCEQHVPNERPLVRKLILLFRDHGAAFFDMRGICYFKSRFRPRCENLYLCSPPNTDLFPLISTARAFFAIAGVLGLLQVSPLSLLKIWFRRRSKTPRAVSAEPSAGGC